VAYPEGTLIVVLGNYDGSGNHVPSFNDPITQYGSISHRAMQPYGDDMLMMDLVGVPSLKRTVFTGTLRPDRVSDLVDPEIHSRLEPLSLTTLLERCWSVYNQSEGQFMFFIPNTDAYGTTTQTTAYVYSYRPSLKVAAWARFDGWNFVCGDSSPVYVDYADDPTINDGDGVPITFDWELPWLDMGKRSRVKNCKYIELDTRGTANFNISMYLDKLMTNQLLFDAPQLSADFAGGDVAGFGSGDAPYGGGRVTAYDKLWAWPCKFKLMKLRLRGQTTEPLKFLSITLLYALGGFNR
jgi:hypothetical protein